MLRVSLLVAACSLMALPAVHAQTVAATIPACTTEEVDSIANIFATYGPNSCVQTPCDTDCSSNLQSVVVSLPRCKSSDGNIWYDYYSSLVSTCQSTETTKTRELDASSAALKDATTEAPKAENPPSAEADTSENTAPLDGTGTSTGASSPSLSTTTYSDAVASTVGTFAAVGSLAVAMILA